MNFKEFIKGRAEREEDVSARYIIVLSRDLLHLIVKEFPGGVSEKQIKKHLNGCVSDKLLAAATAYLHQKDWAHIRMNSLFITPKGIETIG